MLLVRLESENDKWEVKWVDRAEVVPYVAQLAKIDIETDTEGLVLN